MISGSLPTLISRYLFPDISNIESGKGPSATLKIPPRQPMPVPEMESEDF